MSQAAFAAARIKLVGAFFRRAKQFKRILILVDGGTVLIIGVAMVVAEKFKADIEKANVNGRL